MSRLREELTWDDVDLVFTHEEIRQLERVVDALDSWKGHHAELGDGGRNAWGRAQPLLERRPAAALHVAQGRAQLLQVIECVERCAQGRSRRVAPRQVRPVDELRAMLNPAGTPDFEAVAVSGEGVFETLKAIAKLVLTELKKSGG